MVQRRNDSLTAPGYVEEGARLSLPALGPPLIPTLYQMGTISCHAFDTLPHARAARSFYKCTDRLHQRRSHLPPSSSLFTNASVFHTLFLLAVARAPQSVHRFSKPEQRTYRQCR